MEATTNQSVNLIRKLSSQTLFNLCGKCLKSCVGSLRELTSSSVQGYPRSHATTWPRSFASKRCPPCYHPCTSPPNRSRHLASRRCWCYPVSLAGSLHPGRCSPFSRVSAQWLCRVLLQRHWTHGLGFIPTDWPRYSTESSKNDWYYGDDVQSWRVNLQTFRCGRSKKWTEEVDSLLRERYCIGVLG